MEVRYICFFLIGLFLMIFAYDISSMHDFFLMFMTWRFGFMVRKVFHILALKGNLLCLSCTFMVSSFYRSSELKTFNVTVCVIVLMSYCLM